MKGRRRHLGETARNPQCRPVLTLAAAGACRRGEPATGSRPTAVGSAGSAGANPTAPRRPFRALTSIVTGKQPSPACHRPLLPPVFGFFAGPPRRLLDSEPFRSFDTGRISKRW